MKKHGGNLLKVTELLKTAEVGLNPGDVALKCQTWEGGRHLVSKPGYCLPQCATLPRVCWTLSESLFDSGLLKRHSSKYEMENFSSCLWVSRNPLCHSTYPQALLRRAIPSWQWHLDSSWVSTSLQLPVPLPLTHIHVGSDLHSLVFLNRHNRILINLPRWPNPPFLWMETLASLEQKDWVFLIIFKGAKFNPTLCLYLPGLLPNPPSQKMNAGVSRVLQIRTKYQTGYSMNI